MTDEVETIEIPCIEYPEDKLVIEVNKAKSEFRFSSVREIYLNKQAINELIDKLEDAKYKISKYQFSKAIKE